MHPKEYKRIKNNTGRLTHLSLPHSRLFVGVDFTEHAQLNAILNDQNNHACILFPAPDSQPLESSPLPSEKRLVLILIDATWESARPMLRQSRNLHPLPKLSFSHTGVSGYRFKRQPFARALSTMETTQRVLEILTERGMEETTSQERKRFLDPFEKMVETQLKFNP